MNEIENGRQDNRNTNQRLPEQKIDNGIELSGVVIDKYCAVIIDNWLINYQNKHGKNIDRDRVERSDCFGIYASNADNELVGGLTFNIHNDWIFLHCGYIKSEYRGRGIYMNIMIDLVSTARRIGLSGIHTSTYTFETPHIYERYGFTKGCVLHDIPKGNTSIDYYLQFT